MDFQERLANVEINYIDSDIYGLNKHLGDNTYDAMTFSNIYEYLNYGRYVCEENALKYYEFIMKEMYPRLNENGTIMVNYMYAFNDAVRKFINTAIDTGRMDEFVYAEAIPLTKFETYLQGLTSQNYAYTLLLDLFDKENIKKVATAHVEFGQSFDTSHDMALCLNKQR